MATEIQYEVFKGIYDIEGEHYKDIQNSCKIYISICSFFLGGLAFKLHDVFTASCTAAKVAFILSVISFSFAFFFILLAAWAYSYQALCRPSEYIQKLGATPPSDEEFLDDRVVDIAYAWDVNSAINNRKGRFLQVSSIGMFIGVLLAFFSLFMSIL